jgi:hypothetical protein
METGMLSTVLYHGHFQLGGARILRGRGREMKREGGRMARPFPESKDSNKDTIYNIVWTPCMCVIA